MRITKCVVVCILMSAMYTWTYNGNTNVLSNNSEVRNQKYCPRLNAKGMKLNALRENNWYGRLWIAVNRTIHVTDLTSSAFFDGELSVPLGRSNRKEWRAFDLPNKTDTVIVSYSRRTRVFSIRRVIASSIFDYDDNNDNNDDIIYWSFATRTVSQCSVFHPRVRRSELFV